MQPWKKFEYRIRDYFLNHGFNANRIPVSGMSSVIKGDVIAERGDIKFRIDAKSTLGKGDIRINKESLEKIKREAKSDEIPLVIFSFYRHHTLYAIIEESLISKWKWDSVEKFTWAKDSIGLKRKEVIESTRNNAALMFSFKDSKTRFVIMRLDDIIAMDLQKVVWG